MANQHTRRIWTQQDTNYIAEKIEDIKLGKVMSVQDIMDESGLPVGTVRTKLTAIANEKGLDLGSVYGKTTTNPIKIRVRKKKANKNLPKQKFMCKCITKEDKETVWMSAMADSKRDAKLVLLDTFPGIGKIIEILSMEEYKRVRMTTGKQLSSHSLVSGNSRVQRAGRTRRID